MFPYNLQNYQPKSDPEEPISEIRFKKAKEHVVRFMSRDGRFIYKDFMGNVYQAEWSDESMDYESWWLIPNLPNDVIDLGKKE